ncbi:TetR family transcriptional regulator [Providencia sp. wls1943]|uniref:TetR/AcrR family transcriptional regulator n=1 Tax=Providencia sp. wls1943 TaxID=2675150 RepID=UPI0012B66C5F|nr:TetR/AcrR family transcriptional regulator [Providencia sp. wls1943]MTB66082.1 TetR family transcriptional regulator [Providencia sp. wls1943]
MAQKGRPRNYDSHEALNNIMALFWRKGYSATSLEDLVDVTAMKKPSLYAAFGNKARLYELAMARFGEIAQAHYTAALAEQSPNEPLFVRLNRWLRATVSLYNGVDGKTGCMVLSTAVAETDDPQVQAFLKDVILAQETMLIACIEKEKSALREPENARLLVKTLIALLHSVSLRARAGETKEELSALIDAGEMVLRATLVTPENIQSTSSS